jgi:Methyltransferase domain
LPSFTAGGRSNCARSNFDPTSLKLARARGFLDEVYVGDVESDRIELEDDAFDLVVASHVLEQWLRTGVFAAGQGTLGIVLLLLERVAH